MHPDFVFFHEVQGAARASIVDPHGHHLADAALKLRALASFAAEFGDDFHRIEAVSKIGDEMVVLDMQRAAVRDAVSRQGSQPLELYQSDVAASYDAAAG
jgi:hypothetical protein